MLSIIVFSKDRPLQLQSYLESLLYYSDIQQNCIYVLYKATGYISYQTLISQYPNVNWIPENSFYSDLLNILNQAGNYILWGCDDVFYKSSFNVNTCIKALCNNEDLFGFSLRLGRNIQPNPERELIDESSYLIWDWTKLYLPHSLYPQEVWDWGYPWEVSGTIYRKSDIIDFLKVVDEPRNPNYLEGDLANVFRYSRALQTKKYFACFPLSKCLTLTVNRVQETHPNPFDAAKDTTPTRLYNYFVQGYKLNWSKYKDCNNLVIQVGSEYFELQSNEKQPTNLTSSPLVSVICRVYNREEYIEELIVSVLNQTFTDFELLILDDGSTDNTKSVVEKYLSDTRIKYVYQQNIGTTKDGFALDKVLNRAIELTTADLVCIGDSDDVFMPSKLERQVKEFESDPDIDVVFSDGYHIDANGNLLPSNFRFVESLSFNELNLPRTLFKKNIVPNPTVMMKRKAIEIMGGFETGFCPDYQFWLKSAPYLTFKYIDEKLVKYRIHENAMSTGNSSIKRVFEESIKVLGDVRNRLSILDLYPEVYGCSNRHQALYSAYLDFGNTMLTANIPVPSMAIQEYQKALRHNGQATEALNNLAIASWISEDYQSSVQIFNYLKNTAYNSDVVKHNVDLVEQLQAEIAVSNKSFILLKETKETSELLNVMEASNITSLTPKINVKPSDNKTSTQPLVSIIIPCYNHARFLREAVESIVNQTYENWECIIVNDGSPDDTSDVARALINSYKNKSIHLLEQQNDGVINARNVGFSKSLGEYILFVDADDKIHPNFLSETLSVLIEHPSVGFVYTDIQLFGVKHDLISNGDFVPERFLNSNQASVTSLFRREIYEQVNGFKKVMELGWEDWEFWISAYEKGWQGYRLGKAYLYYRQHASGSRLQNLHSSQSNQALQKAKIIKLHSKLYNQREVHWAENILRQHNSPLAIGLTDLHLYQQRKPEIRRIKYPAINYISEGVHRPLWSVMIPTYNGTKYLEQTLRSVLEQDPGSDLMQIEVVDDCSTQDDPEELVREIGQGRISFYRQPKNLGLIGNWNDCIKRARGHWVHILHQDDVVKFGFYKRLQAAVEKEPTIGAAFCRYFYMDEKGCEQALSPLERETPGVISNWIERIAVMQRIECPSIVVKREVYEDLGGFSQEAYYAADWEMWKRIAAHYSVWYEPELLACYRSHSSSESSRLVKSGANIADTRKAIEISESYLPITIAAELSNQARENCAFKALNIARRMLSAGDIDGAIAQMREGIKSSQSSNVISSVLELVQELNKNSNQHNLFPINALDQLLSAFQEPFQKQQETALIESLKLKDINLIIFPDWEQSEELLYEDLASVISSLVNHPNKNQITLLIHTGSLSEDEVSLVLSDIVMNLLMQESTLR